jgi:hypothetical protein
MKYIFSIMHIFQICSFLSNPEPSFIENYFAVKEINLRQVEVLQIISLLRKEPIQVIASDFLKVDRKIIGDFEYIFSMPPIGAEIHHEDEIKGTLGYHGRQLINYIFVKLLKSRKSNSKIAILVPLSFLFLQDSNSNSIGLSILRPSVQKNMKGVRCLHVKGFNSLTY